MGKRRGKKKKPIQNAKKGTTVNAEPEELINAPHSFVFHRGNVGDTVADLTRDFRKVMEPFTASSLKARKANSVKDFLSVAGILHVSHMAIFTATELGTYLKLARVPRGPTLYFKVVNFCLARDVISSLKKQLVFQKQFEHPPLVILNNFGGNDVQLKLMASMFQNMFPSFNLARPPSAIPESISILRSTFKDLHLRRWSAVPNEICRLNLNNVRRCVLFNYNSTTEEIDVRHYSIKIVPVGLSKGVKKIVQSRVPDLSKFEDISEFITKANVLSESEAEDDPASHVTLSQKMSSRGNLPSSQSSVRLVEQGPRMTLQLLKVEDGFLGGEVLYHRNVMKTQEEKQEILQKRLQKRRQKEERKRIQEQMVRRKEKLKEQHKEKSLEGMKRKELMEKAGVEDADDDDAAWYKQEVGKEPEHDLFEKKQGVKRKGSFREYKRAKKAKNTETSGKPPGKNKRAKGKDVKLAVPGIKGKFFKSKKQKK